ncbi:MAG: hypothetical protein ACKV2T_05305 [Kofleriaceae bacterium]
MAFGSAVWIVAGDKPLALEPPKEYGANDVDRPALVNIELIGSAIIASWYTCAGPCGQSILVDTRGANRGDWFGAGVVFPLDAKRLAVLAIESANGSGSEFIVIDLASAT